MSVSGITITLSGDTGLAAAAVAQLQAHPAFTLGDAAGRWLPAAMEWADEPAAMELHDWLNALPGVTHVDVVFVGSEGERPTVDPQPLSIQ